MELDHLLISRHDVRIAGNDDARSQVGTPKKARSTIHVTQGIIWLPSQADVRCVETISSSVSQLRFAQLIILDKCLQVNPFWGEFSASWVSVSARGIRPEVGMSITSSEPGLVCLTPLRAWAKIDYPISLAWL